jgi:dTDP-L-rhamnose 4-epimerase
MRGRALITGGAGFIGSHLADELLRHGYEVRVLDNLTPQVHGSGEHVFDVLSRDVDLMVGDVRDEADVRCALDGVDVVVHLAAAVGVGQSMYQIDHYTSVNNLGTAVLLQALADTSIDALVVASSMSVYGEGVYRDASGRQFHDVERSIPQLKAGEWEPRGPDGEVLEPLPTPETKLPSLSSIYALSKYDQERMCLIVGRAYGIPTTALRFFNVYGPRQALSNPYTGVLAIFASRLLNNRPPLIFEDGLQQRDFVSVYDVARSCRLALERPQPRGLVLNIGSGAPQTVRRVAELVAAGLRCNVDPEITGKYRVGDIRHCFGDISRAAASIGYRPEIAFEDGLADLITWLEGQMAEDRVAEASAELASRGLTL